MMRERPPCLRMGTILHSSWSPASVAAADERVAAARAGGGNRQNFNANNFHNNVSNNHTVNRNTNVNRNANVN